MTKSDARSGDYETTKKRPRYLLVMILFVPCPPLGQWAMAQKIIEDFGLRPEIEEMH